MNKAKKTNDGAQIVASSKLILSLINRSNEVKTRMQPVSGELGELGEEIKDAVETKHVHAAALKHVTKLARFDAVKRNDFLRSVAIYIDMAIEGGLFDGEHMGDLIDKTRDAAGNDATKENVRLLQGGIKQLA